MADREKVLKGLECCSGSDICVGPKCPYWNCVVDCVHELEKDALELLKKQENLETRHKIIVDSYDELLASLKVHQIVRCKDCIHHLECDYWIENGDDWFCADGERPKCNDDYCEL